MNQETNIDLLNKGRQPEAVQQGKDHAESPQSLLAVVVVAPLYCFFAAPLQLLRC